MQVQVQVPVPEAGGGKGQDERQKLQASAAQVASRATTPAPDVMAGQPSTAPNQTKPTGFGDQVSVEELQVSLNCFEMLTGFSLD